MDPTTADFLTSLGRTSPIDSFVPIQELFQFEHSAWDMQPDHESLSISNTDNPLTRNTHCYKSNVVVLIDSNGKLIDKHRLQTRKGQENVAIVPCETAEQAVKFADNPPLRDPNMIIISSGVTDIETCTPQVVHDNIMNAALKLSATFPSCRVAVSGIVRTDNLMKQCQEVNDLLEQSTFNCSDSSIDYLPVDNLKDPDLFYDEKHFRKEEGVARLVAHLKNGMKKGLGYKSSRQVRHKNSTTESISNNSEFSPAFMTSEPPAPTWVTQTTTSMESEPPDPTCLTRITMTSAEPAHIWVTSPTTTLPTTMNMGDVKYMLSAKPIPIGVTCTEPHDNLPMNPPFASPENLQSEPLPSCSNTDHGQSGLVNSAKAYGCSDFPPTSSSTNGSDENNQSDSPPCYYTSCGQSVDVESAMACGSSDFPTASSSTNSSDDVTSATKSARMHDWLSNTLKEGECGRMVDEDSGICDIHDWETFTERYMNEHYSPKPRKKSELSKKGKASGIQFKKEKPMQKKKINNIVRAAIMSIKGVEEIMSKRRFDPKTNAVVARSFKIPIKSPNNLQKWRGKLKKCDSKKGRESSCNPAKGASCGIKSAGNEKGVDPIAPSSWPLKQRDSKKESESGYNTVNGASCSIEPVGIENCVDEIIASSGPFEGGNKVCVVGKSPLDSSTYKGPFSVTFDENPATKVIELKNGFDLKVVVPQADLAKSNTTELPVSVVVRDSERNFVGETTYTYVASFNEIRQQGLTLTNLDLDDLLDDFNRDVSSAGNSNDPPHADGKNIAGDRFESDVNNKNIRNLEAMVYGAAKLGSEGIISMVLNSNVGRQVYELYQTKPFVPVDVARHFGHHNLATFINVLEQRFNRLSCPTDFGKKRNVKTGNTMHFEGDSSSLSDYDADLSEGLSSLSLSSESSVEMDNVETVSFDDEPQEEDDPQQRWSDIYEGHGMLTVSEIAGHGMLTVSEIADIRMEIGRWWVGEGKKSITRQNHNWTQTWLGIVHLQTVNEGPFKELELRSYQKGRSRPALQGKNTIIFAPTNSGKTYVALGIAKNHLEKRSDGRVIFVVSTVNLVLQQKQRFQIHLPAEYKIGAISGTNSSSSEMPLEVLIRSNKVVILTAQILVNALTEKRLKLSDISMLIFDECHHTTKEHPYNMIMAQYMDARLGGNDEPGLPQVVGLTASVGVGKAAKHILQVCANMDAEEVVTVTENADELNEHVSTPQRDIYPVEKPEINVFENIINQAMKNIERFVRRSPVQYEMAPAERAGQQYRHWCESLLNVAETVGNRYVVTCAEQLREYHVALTVNEATYTKDALEYLRRYFDKLDEETFTNAYRTRLENYKGAMKALDESVLRYGEPQNPKLQELKELIFKYHEVESDSKGILFSTTRESTIALESWIQECEELKSVLKPKKLVGTADGSDGMTQYEQEAVIKAFRDGDVNIIIATTVAEEGLDISDCNYVIRYDMKGNEISTVQSRGRIRARDGKYSVVVSAKSGGVAREEINSYREMLMVEAIGHVQKMSAEEFTEKEKRFGNILYKSDENSMIGKQGPKGTRVYRGKLASNGQDVVVKKIFVGLSDWNKAYALRELKHPNVVRCFAAEEAEDFIYIALELCDKTLVEFLEGGNFAREKLSRRSCLIQVAQAVKYLHEQGWCHRDIKPGNVLVTGGGDASCPRRFLLADANISKETHNETFSTKKPVAGDIGWIANEVYQPGFTVSPNSDIFSLGCTFYYTLTNMKHPFGGDGSNLDDCQKSIQCGREAVLKTGDFVELPNLERLIKNMVAHFPDKRPTAAIVCDKLQQVTEHV